MTSSASKASARAAADRAAAYPSSMPTRSSRLSLAERTRSPGSSATTTAAVALAASAGVAAAPAPPHAMSNGTAVVVRDLAKAQEHNDKIGKITGWDQTKGRYEVEVEGETTLSLRPSNLTQQVSVTLTGIESQPDLNGQAANIFNFQGGRYMVRLKTRLANGRDVVGLQPGNVILPSGTRVVVQGLSNEQFNGLMGQITEVDREALKYTVNCQNGKHIKIKLENVLC